MNRIRQTIQHGQHGIHQFSRILAHIGQGAIVSMVLTLPVGSPSLLHAEPTVHAMTKEQAVKLGEDFGIIVGEVDEEIREFLGLEQAKGVVVFEVIGGKPAALAGIKSRALIKEINSVEVTTLEDFGLALQDALPTENFSVATYEPADPDNQGISGGINFHFVRIEKS
jgi:membrane-associated protease RseP (regulator of RpoE activity)